MMKVLLTGGSGFIGKNILPQLRDEFEVIAPSRTELNLLDQNAVYEYVECNKFDVILHCANPNGVKNELDDTNKMLEDSLRVFLNIYNTRNLCDKILYLGSGAEYDIATVDEASIGKSIPVDSYGLAKYTMNEIARNSKNVYNMRIFACYGPYDYHTKFITHCINCCMRNEEITIRQDCYFDYIHVFDLAKVIKHFILNKMLYHDYNICSGNRITLSDIAKKVQDQMNNHKDIVILKDGMNKEYTASNKRLLAEYSFDKKISIDEGINLQIEWEMKH